MDIMADNSVFKLDIDRCNYTSPPIVSGDQMFVWSNPYFNVESSQIYNLNYWELRRLVIIEWDSSWSKEKLYEFVYKTILNGLVGKLNNFKVIVDDIPQKETSFYERIQNIK